MDILIKSFSRPYYPDRCSFSIYKNIKDFKNILFKYQEVNIIESEAYLKKNKSIEKKPKTGKKINGFEIHSKLWIDSVTNSSNYVISTENDVWFTKSNNVNLLLKIMKDKNIYLLKLSWFGKKKRE